MSSLSNTQISKHTFYLAITLFYMFGVVVSLHTLDALS